MLMAGGLVPGAVFMGRVAADYLYRVLEILALCHRGISGVVKADYAPPKTYHSRLKAHLGAGGRLIKQRSHDLPAALVRIALRARHNVLRKTYHRVPLRNAVIVHIN